MKDPERDARAARYAAEQDEQYYRTNQTQQQQEYYVEEEPATPLEQAYWSTMPSSYKGDGQVKIVNNYYDSRYVEKKSLGTQNQHIARLRLGRRMVRSFMGIRHIVGQFMV